LTYFFLPTNFFRQKIFAPLYICRPCYPKGKGRSGKKKFTPNGKKVYAVQNPRLWPKAVGRDTKSFKFGLNLFFLFCRGVWFSSRRIVGRGSGLGRISSRGSFRLYIRGKRSEGAAEFFRLYIRGKKITRQNSRVIFLLVFFLVNFPGPRKNAHWRRVGFFLCHN
jgi:hypothetical protein